MQSYDSVMCGYFCVGFINFIVKDKSLTAYTNLFSPNDFLKQWWYDLKLFYDLFLKMVEFNSIETPNMYWNLNDLQQFRLNKIHKIKDNFIPEIKERELMSNSKYIVSFGYIDKLLPVLSATSYGISISSFATFIGATAGIANASFSRAFSISTGIIKKLLKTMQIKGKSTIKLSC